MPDEKIDDTEVEDTEEQVEEEADSSEESEEDFVPPSKEDWAKVQRVAKARKTERDNLKRELAVLKSKDAESDEDKTERTESAKWRETAARSSAAVALQAAGYSGTAKLARQLTRLLDLSTAEPDESGDFDFEDEIDEIKTNFPALFEAKKVVGSGPRRVTTADRGGSGEAPGRDKTSERMLKMAGYR